MTMHLSPPEIMEIREAVTDALCDAFRNPALSEPQLIANLVSKLPKKINQIKPFRGTKIHAGGVFVHARPFVKCTSFPDPSPGAVEIGDLLLIRTLVVNKKVTERRALLLQAKKANSIPTVPDNRNQWHLYEQWPRFTYATRSGGLKGKPRHINEPDMYDAAKYLLIGNSMRSSHHPEVCCMDCYPYHHRYHSFGNCAHHTAQPTKPEISRYRCFASELIEFIIGNAGKNFEKPAPRTRGWNRVIDDLIEETAKAKTIFMARAAGASMKYPRGAGVMFITDHSKNEYFMVGGGVGGEGINVPPEVPEYWGEYDQAGGGISIVEFVVEQREDGELWSGTASL